MALGHFFGGVTQGLESAERHSLRQRALDLQEQTLGQAKRQQLQTTVNDRIKSTLTAASGFVEGFGKDMEAQQGVPLILATLGQMESGGQKAPYLTQVDAGKGRTALGKYGILSTNIDPANPNNWLREAGLPDMTPDEFLASKTAQDQVAAVQVLKLLQKYNGDTRKVAAEWLGGPDWESTMNAGVTDNKGTSIPAYVARFERAFPEVTRNMINQGLNPFKKSITSLAGNAGNAGITVDSSSAIQQLETLGMGFQSNIQKARMAGQAAGVEDVAGAPGAGEAEAIRRQTLGEGLEAGGTPKPEAAILSQQRVKPSTPLVQITNQQETEFKKGMGKFFAKDMGTMIASARTSTQRIGQLDRMNSAIDDMLTTGEGTGPGAPLSTSGRRAAMAWNRFAPEGARIDVKDISNEEMIVALGNQMALLMRNPDSGFGLTGNTSQRDLEFLIASVPGLQTTVAGNKLLIDFMVRDAQRNVDVARAAQEYVDDPERGNGKLDVEFYLQLEDELEKNPLITEEDIESARAIVAEEQAASGATGNIRRYNPETGRIE